MIPFLFPSLSCVTFLYQSLNIFVGSLLGTLLDDQAASLTKRTPENIGI